MGTGLSGKAESPADNVDRPAVPGHLEFEEAWRRKWEQTIDEITAKRDRKKKSERADRLAAAELVARILAKK